MKDTSLTKFNKSHSESSMKTTALVEAKSFYERLMEHYFRDRKDTNGSARGRLADDMGVNEHKLVRLEHYFDEMKDVSGELYRRLNIWCDAICEKNEAATAKMRAERLKLKAKRHDAGNRNSAAQGGRGHETLE